MASWHKGYQVWLTEAQSLDNAQLVANRLIKNGWVKESICALCGNMRHESSLNPNMYEFGMSWGADRGFGLVQWTPRSKYWNWALQKGFKESELRDGEAQMDRIDYEAKNGLQWIATPNYPESFKTFRSNGTKKSIEYLTKAFIWNYERPLASAGEQSTPERIAFAQKCAEKLNFDGSSEGGDGGDDKPSTGGESGSGIGDTALGMIKKAMEELIKKLEDAMQWDLHSIGAEKYFSNSFFSLQKTFNNTYHMQMNVKILDDMKDLIDGIDTGGSSGGKDPETGDPDPDKKAEYSLKNIRYENDNNLNYPFDPSGTNPNYPFPRPHLGVDLNFQNERLNSPVSGKAYIKHDPLPSWQGGTGFGNHVMIEGNDGYFYIFGHMSAFSIENNTDVKVGTHLGTTGNTGDSTGPHLHFEVRKTKISNPYGGTVVDPAVWREMVKRKMK